MIGYSHIKAVSYCSHFLLSYKRMVKFQIEESWENGEYGPVRNFAQNVMVRFHVVVILSQLVTPRIELNYWRQYSSNDKFSERSF